MCSATSTYQVDLRSKIDTESKCGDEDEICEHLDNGMEPKESWEAEQANTDGSKGEEHDKG